MRTVHTTAYLGRADRVCGKGVWAMRLWPLVTWLHPPEIITWLHAYHWLVPLTKLKSPH